MKNVFLIRPRWPYPVSGNDSTYNRIWFPLSLSYCSSILKQKGYNVSTIDFHALRGIDEEQRLNEIKPSDSVFLSTGDIDRWQCPNLDTAPIKKISSIIKNRTANFFVMGPHGTLFPDKTIKFTGALAVIRGEPEFKVIDILSAGYKKTAGISYLENNKIVNNPNGKDVDMASLPLPDFSIFSGIDYFYEIFGGQFILLETTRNCPHSCTFCNKSVYGMKYRKKTAGRVVQEVKGAIKAGAKRAYFIDLDIGVDSKHLESICDALIEADLDFEWCCQTRLDELDEPAIIKMYKAKCRIIHFGLESGSQDVINGYNKKLNLKNVSSVISLCRKYSIKTVCFSIFGDDGKENNGKTIELMKKLNPTYASFHVLTDYGKELFENNKKTALDGIRKKAYLEYYLRPAYIKNINLKNIPGHAYLFSKFLI